MSGFETPESLLEEHRDALTRYLARFTGDPDLAEDLVQETFLRFVERPPPDRRGSRAWLFTVATNLARDASRADRRRAALPRDAGPMGSAPPDPAAAVERAEARARIAAALAPLAARERTAVLMRAEGFRHREIAEAIDTTTASVGTILARAMIKMGRTLGVPIPREKENDP